jgi:hypothetical protein
VSDCLSDRRNTNECGAASVNWLRVCRYENLVESHPRSFAHTSLKVVHVSNFAAETDLADCGELWLDGFVECR